ncbi:MAG: helix-turn-helix transcriptional regulator [Propionibacteriaceae bacterium]|jgi:DNA-binding CsgD family transcriptional regulator|nr:helix-turn-helix transcriptional regulator [Propionibacteriaceae bacterium]
MHSGLRLADVVGRDAEASRTRSVMEGTDAGGSALLVTSAPGMGRTTVINYAASCADVDVIRMPGVPGLTSRPYDSITHGLRAVSGHHDLGPLLPRVLQQLDESAGQPSPELASDLLSLLSQRPRVGVPLVFVMDDVHYYDPTSQDLITLLAHHAHSVGLRCVLSADATVDLSHLAGIHRLALPPLDVTAVRSMIELGTGLSIPHRVARSVHSWSGGNPLLARDLLDRLSRAQVAGEQPIGAGLEPSPAALQRISRSIAGLSTDQTEMLAVLARCDHLPSPLLHGGPTSCTQIVEQLVAAGKLLILHGGVVPRHRSEALAAWSSLPPTAQQRLDSWIAGSIESTHPAHAYLHRALAGDPDAVQRLPQTAQELLAVGEVELGMAATVLAEHALPEMPSSTALQLARLQLRECYVEPVRSKGRQLLARNAPMDLGWASVMVALAVITGDESDLLPDQQPAPPSEDLLEPWLQTGADRCRAYLERGDLGQAQQLADMLQADARRSSEEIQRVFAMVQAELGLPSQQPGTDDRLFEAIQSWRAVASPAFDINCVVAMFDLLTIGRLAEARSLLVRSGSMESLRHATARSAYLTVRIELEIAAGMFRRAGASLLELDRERPFSGAAGHTVRGQAVRVNAACGDLPGGELIQRRLDNWVQPTMPLQARASYWAAVGYQQLIRGQYRRSRDLITLALRGHAALTQGRADALADLVEAVVAMGDLEGARRDLDRYSVWLPDAHGDRAPALLARCRALTAPAEEMDRTFAEALDLHVASHEVDRARTLTAYGRVLTHRGRTVDARAVLEEALEIYRADELHGWAGHAQGLLTTSVKEVRRADAELTETEHRLLALVRQGRRNREIADAMYVSLRTVEAHLTRIFRKFGVSTKAQLLRYLDDKPHHGESA